eukprot:2752889-Prymnesium_polylepis.1
MTKRKGSRQRPKSKVRDQPGCPCARGLPACALCLSLAPKHNTGRALVPPAAPECTGIRRLKRSPPECHVATHAPHTHQESDRGVTGEYPDWHAPSRGRISHALRVIPHLKGSHLQRMLPLLGTTKVLPLPQQEERSEPTAGWPWPTVLFAAHRPYTAHRTAERRVVASRCARAAHGAPLSIECVQLGLGLCWRRQRRGRLRRLRTRRRSLVAALRRARAPAEGAHQRVGDRREQRRGLGDDVRLVGLLPSPLLLRAREGAA